MKDENVRAVVDKLHYALMLYTCHPCPVCNGDCASANPPVMACPTNQAIAAYAAYDALLAQREEKL